MGGCTTQTTAKTSPTTTALVAEHAAAMVSVTQTLHARARRDTSARPVTQSAQAEHQTLATGTPGVAHATPLGTAPVSRVTTEQAVRTSAQVVHRPRATCTAAASLPEPVPATMAGLERIAPNRVHVMGRIVCVKTDTGGRSAHSSAREATRSTATRRRACVDRMATAIALPATTATLVPMNARAGQAIPATAEGSVVPVARLVFVIARPDTLALHASTPVPAARPTRAPGAAPAVPSMDIACARKDGTGQTVAKLAQEESIIPATAGARVTKLLVPVHATALTFTGRLAKAYALAKGAVSATTRVSARASRAITVPSANISVPRVAGRMAMGCVSTRTRLHVSVSRDGGVPRATILALVVPRILAWETEFVMASTARASAIQATTGTRAKSSCARTTATTMASAVVLLAYVLATMASNPLTARKEVAAPHPTYRASMALSGLYSRLRASRNTWRS